MTRSQDAPGSGSEECAASRFRGLLQCMYEITVTCGVMTTTLARIMTGHACCDDDSYAMILVWLPGEAPQESNMGTVVDTTTHRI